MPTLKEKQTAAEHLIRQLVASPASFKGTTLSGKKYDFFYIDEQTNHTVFSALMKTGHYTAAKNILKHLPVAPALYNPAHDERVMRFCHFDQCGPMLRFLKTPSRRAMVLAQLSFKTRNELSTIAQLIKTRLSLSALEEWTGDKRPWRDTMTSSYTGAAATAQALEDEEEKRFERYQRNSAEKQSAPQDISNQPAGALTHILRKVAAHTPTTDEPTKPVKIENDHQTNFDHLLFPKQHTGRE